MLVERMSVHDVNYLSATPVTGIYHKLKSYTCVLFQKKSIAQLTFAKKKKIYISIYG